MSETKRINIGPERRKEFDDIIRKAAKPHAVEGDLDSRYTYKDEGKVRWGAYERYLLSSGHTLYLNLQTKVATVSKEPDTYAQGKVEKRLAREKKAADRKAAKAARAAERKTKGETVKVKAKTTTQLLPITEFDPKVSTLDVGPLVPAKRGKFTQEQADRIDAIIRERKCTRGNAIKALRNEEAIKAADAQA